MHNSFALEIATHLTETLVAHLDSLFFAYVLTRRKLEALVLEVVFKLCSSPPLSRHGLYTILIVSVVSTRNLAYGMNKCALIFMDLGIHQYLLAWFKCLLSFKL